MSHFKWYTGGSTETIPPNAAYKFPSESTRAEKTTPRIAPKNGAIFGPGDTIRLEHPADGFTDLRATTIEFDLTLTGWGDTLGTTRMQNDIQSCFQRVRVLYGGSPLEDHIDYNSIKRFITEVTATNGGVMNQETISQGMGGQVVDCDPSKTTAVGTTFTTRDEALPNGGGYEGHCNARQKYIQGLSPLVDKQDVGAHFVNGGTFGNVGEGTAANSVTRRYSIQLAVGLYQQRKLMPTAYMASQFSVEITLERASACIYSPVTGGSTAPTYSINNVNLIPVVMSFSDEYQDGFEVGLNEKGIPIPFATWRKYGHVVNGSDVNINIQDKSRSVKAIFTLQKRNNPAFQYDSGASFFDTHTQGGSTLQTAQYRIGTRYFPASPMEFSRSGSAVSNGGAEGKVELDKALGTLGDSRLSSNVSASTWALQRSRLGDGITADLLQEYDYKHSVATFESGGQPNLALRETALNGFCGTLASASFGLAVNLETDDGAAVSGLNAQEQSDITLVARWYGAQQANFNLMTFVYVDRMLIIEKNNRMVLVE
jgi:hypothetical protein